MMNFEGLMTPKGFFPILHEIYRACQFIFMQLLSIFYPF